MNREYSNYATRHLETLNVILDQMENINRNMYSIYQRPSNTTNTRRTTMYRPYGSRHTTTQPAFQTTIPTATGNNTTTATATTAAPLLNNILTSWFWDPVRITATQEEIDAATSEVAFSDLPENTTTCPISMEPFNEESEILKINACGHIFSRAGITRWFRNHVTCPVCRHDIRNNGNSNANANANAQINTSTNIDTNVPVRTGFSATPIGTPMNSTAYQQLRDSVVNRLNDTQGATSGAAATDATGGDQLQTYQVDFTFDSADLLNSFLEHSGLALNDNQTTTGRAGTGGRAGRGSNYTNSFYNLPYPPNN